MGCSIFGAVGGWWGLYDGRVVPAVSYDLTVGIVTKAICALPGN